MNFYLPFVQEIEKQFRAGKALPVGGVEPHASLDFSPDAPRALLFSPHPDDECIIGLLPLRLMREVGMKIINVPVTFGSNVERQPGRAAELENACGFLGMEVFRGLEPTTSDFSASPRKDDIFFQGLEKPEVVEILKTLRPAVIFVPHSKDWNSRHISTHFLAIETEFWGAMEDPNLMVEADAETLADLVAATSFHVKEVKRNPYHLSLPAWMQDNVRRGGELIGGQGGAVPDFAFATLYRLSRWENGKLFQPCGVSF